METLKATFTEFKYNSEAKKKESKWTKIQVEDTLHPVAISFNGVVKTLYMRGKDLHIVEWTVPLYNADGSYYAGALWKHGHTGSKMHKEGLNYSNYKKSVVVNESYCEGNIKDKRKYLLAI